VDPGEPALEKTQGVGAERVIETLPQSNVAGAEFCSLRPRILKRAARTISTFLSTSVSEDLELAETDATGAGGMMLKIDRWLAVVGGVLGRRRASAGQGKIRNCGNAGQRPEDGQENNGISRLDAE
jgi:hypothetical protein